jgi:hypothetical protein
MINTDEFILVNSFENLASASLANFIQKLQILELYT